eukprot:Nitzschia sp. Nitz4//scaffold18_size181773//16682//17599//NITZ4_001894-RA/size181773-processed-gene-0.39-mRNA-1//-1//CDS//3329539948//584//frame0
MLTNTTLTDAVQLDEVPSLLKAAPSSQLNNKNTSCSSTETNLAGPQSFGFFDDVPNDTWKRVQELHRNSFPNHEPHLERRAGDKATSHIWYNDNFHAEFHCQTQQRIPLSLKGDGAKWVCDPHRLRNKPDCLVYSVGSSGEVSFERGIRDVVGKHCEIHTFDIITYNKRRGDFAQNLDGIATFHHWGLGTEAQARKNSDKFKTLAQTMEFLGHANRTIDIFKIDCEGCEWSTVQDWLQQDLRQILVETHDAPWPEAKNFFYSLHDAGYVIYSKEPNLFTKGTAIEYSFLKLSLDFFEDTFYKNVV